MAKNSPAAQEYELVGVNVLKTHPRNARQGDIGAIHESIVQNGLFGACVVQRSTCRIIAGNHRYLAAVEAGLSEVPVIWIDVDDDRALRILLADNKTNDDASYDQASLAAILSELADTSDLLGTGYSGDDLDQLIADMAGDSGTGGSDFGDDEQEDETASFAIFSKEAIVDNAFKWFRAQGFPYRKLSIHACMHQINQLASTDIDKLLRTNVGYHVADTYNPHRFHASAEAMKSPVEAFDDDKLLRRALGLSQDQGKIPDGYITQLNIVSGTQACSNFRPGFAAYLYRTYCKEGDTVLDTSTGYGGRLVGFLGSGINGKYIGIDPNKPTHEGNGRMAKDLGVSDRVALINQPAEDVDVKSLKGKCDFAFTSPPYFAKEHYSDDDTQSWKRYATGEAWRDGFLLPMLRLTYAALKPGKTAIINIADVNLRGKTYPLVEWTIEAAKKAGFKHVKTDQFEMTNRVGAGMDDEVATEPVLVFEKLS